MVLQRYFKFPHNSILAFDGVVDQTGHNDDNFASLNDTDILTGMAWDLRLRASGILTGGMDLHLSGNIPA